MNAFSLNNISTIRLLTALFSLFLSAIAFYTDDIINPDGILYVDMAEAFLLGGLAETVKHFDWPFFSIIIAYFHKITTIPIEISANIINTLLFVLLTDTLLLISNRILPNNRQLAIAAVLILSFPVLNEYRDFIIRDIGYWALSSLALYRFILFLDSPSIKSATLWQLFAITAILFRIEGVVILLGLPLYLFYQRPFLLATKQIFQLNYLIILGVVSASLFALGQSGLTASFGKLASIMAYINIDELLIAFNNKADILGSQILNHFSERYSALILVSGLMVMLFYKLVKALSVGYIALYILSIKQKKELETPSYQQLIIYYILLNILILLTFIFLNYFVSTRYSVLALIGLLLFMLPVICNVIENAWQNRKRAIPIIAGLIITISLVDAMTQSNSKTFIIGTASWAASNLPQGSHILTNEKSLRYYFSKHNGHGEFDVKEAINSYADYDYLLIVEKRRNAQLKSQLGSMSLELLYSSKNKRGDQAIVYKVDR